MKEYSWSKEKNLILKANRGISFEEIVTALDEGHLLDEVYHPTKPQQSILVVEIKGYPWDVPYVLQLDGRKFLKTAFPNRKRK